jgi:hypothetical protein
LCPDGNDRRLWFQIILLHMSYIPIRFLLLLYYCFELKLELVHAWKCERALTSLT